MTEISGEAQSVLDFWFDPAKTRQENVKTWFEGKEQDDPIREKFSDLVCTIYIFIYLILFSHSDS